MKLSPDKTDFIINGDKHTRESLMPRLAIIFFQTSNMPTDEVNNPGVTFYSENTIDNHIRSVVNVTITLRICNVSVNMYLLIPLANAMVSSQLDYCNSLLYKVSKGSATKF